MTAFVKPFYILTSVSCALLLNGCVTHSPARIKYPENQVNQTSVSNKTSQMEVAKSAYQFSDNDIQVPAYFDTQGLKYCTFERHNEDARCPLKKPTIRVYFDKNLIQVTNNQNSDDQQDTKNNQKAQQALAAINNQQIESMLENLVSGINRFRIITKDDAKVQAEIERQLATDPSAAAQRLMNRKAVNPDYILTVDTLKTADRFYAEYNGVAQYNLEMTAAVLDPFTREKLPSPNIGKIRINSNEVRDKSELVFTEVSGRYYSGFNYTNAQNVQAVMSDMVSRGLTVMITRLLKELPATAQVVGIRGNQISLDRGQNAGVLPKETMIIFTYDAGFVDPIGIAEVNPSKNSAVGRIIRWKNNDIAKSIAKQSERGIYRPDNAQKIYAVSVGAPEDYIKNRL